MNRHPWRRWLALLALVILVVVAFVNLGEWQLARLDQRRASNTTVTAHENAPVQPYAQVMNRTIVDADEWQRVTVTGTYLPQDQLVVRYRSNLATKETGWETVVPLQASDGRVVLIDRGFKPRTPGTDFPASEAAPPTGTVTITGYVRRNEQSNDPNPLTPAAGSVRLINSTALAKAFGTPLVDGYIGALTTTPTDPGGFTPMAPPPLDEGPHWSYAMQWFSFSLIAIVGLFVFIRNDIRDAKKAEARKASAAAAIQPSAEPRTDA